MIETGKILLTGLTDYVGIGRLHGGINVFVEYVADTASFRTVHLLSEWSKFRIHTGEQKA